MLADLRSQLCDLGPVGFNSPRLSCKPADCENMCFFGGADRTHCEDLAGVCRRASKIMHPPCREQTGRQAPTKVMAQARPRVPEVHQDGRSIRSCYVTPPAKTVVRHSNSNRNKLPRDPTARGNAGSRNIHTNCKRTGRSPMQLLEEGRGDNRYDSLSLSMMMGQVTASQNSVSWSLYAYARSPF